MSGLLQVDTVFYMPGFAGYLCVGSVSNHSVHKEVLDVQEINKRPQIFSAGNYSTESKFWVTEKSVRICNPQSPETLWFSCDESLSLVSPKAGLQPHCLSILKHKPLRTAMCWLASSTPLKKIRDPVSKPCGYTGLAAQERWRAALSSGPWPTEEPLSCFGPLGVFTEGVWISWDCCPHQHFSAWRGLCYQEREGEWWPSHPSWQPAGSSSFPLEAIPPRCLASTEAAAGTNITYTQSYWSRVQQTWFVLCSGDYTSSVHPPRAVGRQQPQPHRGCTSHSLRASKASPTFLHPEEMVFSFFSRPFRRHRSHIQTCGLFPAPGVWLFTCPSLTMLTFANKQ